MTELIKESSAEPPTDIAPSEGPPDDSDPGRLQRALASGLPAIGFGALFIGLFILFSLLKPDVFLTASTIKSILQTSVIAMLLAIGLVFVLIVRDFDLSIAASAGLAGSTAVLMMSDYHQSVLVAVLSALGAGLLAGVLNGFIVAYLGANALITTLATASVFSGLQEWITKSSTVTTGIKPGYLKLTSVEWFSMPAVVVVTVILAVLATAVLAKTVFGRHAYSTGANQAASHLAGVRTRSVRFWAFLILGLFAGAAGVAITSLAGSTPQAGSTNTYLLPAYAAAFLGAITLGRGRFSAWSAVFGVLFVNMLQTGLIVVQAPTFTSDLLTGCGLVVAVLISRATKSTTMVR